MRLDIQLYGTAKAILLDIAVWCNFHETHLLTESKLSDDEDGRLQLESISVSALSTIS